MSVDGQQFSLQGRTAVVTGASRGIGAASAVALDNAGARVAVIARTGTALAALAATLRNDPVCLPCDLAEPGDVSAVASTVLDTLGHVDVLVNNAAVAHRLPTSETTAPLIDELFALNVRAPLLLIAALVPSMLGRGRGSIINVSSVSAIVGTPQRAAYAASKGAIDAATRSLAVELGPSGIRVNSVAPGVVDTAMWEKSRTVPGVVESVNGLTALRRWAKPEDVADVVVFLASDAARFVTGETICADGGMARTMNLFAGEV